MSKQEHSIEDHVYDTHKCKGIDTEKGEGESLCTLYNLVCSIAKTFNYIYICIYESFIYIYIYTVFIYIQRLYMSKNDKIYPTPWAQKKEEEVN